MRRLQRQRNYARGWRQENGSGRESVSVTEAILLVVLFIVVLLAFPGRSRAETLDDQVVALAAFAAIDYRQSVDAFYHQSGYYEMNPLLGKHPSRRALFAFGVIGVGLTWAAGQVLPQAWAAVVVDSIVASEQWNIEDNALLTSEGRRRMNGIPVIVTWRF